MDFIDTIGDLRAIYGEAGEAPRKKQLPMLDRHAKDFLALSPFAVIATQAPEGLGDASPRGDGPGFAHVLDDRTIALPDRPGNRRLDTLENIVRNPAVGLIFMIPGMNETLRINGTARITTDEALCARLAMNDRPALSALVIEVREVYMHCAKAFMRSHLWKPETWPERGAMPSLGQILRDQIKLAASAEAIDEDLAKAYRATLW
ncbi:pyridoxamine 5'-phosphate oxidase family protein [Aquicoccus sp. SCR17]|nr:pyridoxamine 5'-phosphate oxidase family protein [Carideicomes alvinocaridis]